MDLFLTTTCTHKRPGGTGTLTTIQAGVVCSPPDPIESGGGSPDQAYPIEKLFNARQFFTEYTAFVAGDYVTFNSTDYAVRVVQPWATLGGLSTYYRVVAEVKSGS